MPAPDMRLNPIRDTQFPLKEGIYKNKQTSIVYQNKNCDCSSSSSDILSYAAVTSYVVSLGDGSTSSGSLSSGIVETVVGSAFVFSFSLGAKRSFVASRSNALRHYGIHYLKKCSKHQQIGLVCLFEQMISMERKMFRIITKDIHTWTRFETF